MESGSLSRIQHKYQKYTFTFSSEETASIVEGFKGNVVELVPVMEELQAVVYPEFQEEDPTFAELMMKNTILICDKLRTIAPWIDLISQRAAASQEPNNAARFEDLIAKLTCGLIQQPLEKQEDEANDPDSIFIRFMILKIDEDYPEKEYFTEQRKSALEAAVAEESGEKGQIELNLNAATLVLQFFNQVVADSFNCGRKLASGEEDSTLSSLKVFYANSAKLYFVDKFLCNAMFQPVDDLFYSD